MTLIDLLLSPVRAFKSGYNFIWHVFIRNMPLDDFDDFNAYREKRKGTTILYRYRRVAAQLPERGRVLECGFFVKFSG